MKPSNLLVKQAKKLFENPETQQLFINALLNPVHYYPHILWTQPKPNTPPFEVLPPYLPSINFVDRLALNVKPGRHSLHEQGAYYVLDFSSILAASILMGIEKPVLSILDLCASPGGKALFAWKCLQPSFLLCNEVIRKRLRALYANLKRCGVPCEVISKDSKPLALSFPNHFSVVLVDAPCSGQSLLAKGEKNDGCFHPRIIQMNARRQKRIISNAAQMVAPGGYLAYMTCTYSLEENENLIHWFLMHNPQFTPIPLEVLTLYQSPHNHHPAYRLWPHQGQGAGSFAVLLRRR